MYYNKSYVDVVSFSEYLTVLYSPPCDDARW